MSSLSPRFDAPALADAVQRIATAIAALPQDPSGPQAPRAFLVGGCVRDALMGHASQDADLEIYGVPEEAIIVLLGELFGTEHVLSVGEAFSVLKVVVTPGVTLDVALPRRESKTGPGHKDFAVTGDPHLSFEEACRRRDFTMNAILFDPLTEKTIDPFDGKSDIETKTLRAVDATTFVEDPLRVYRAVQFAARFDATLDEGTRALLETMVARGDLDALSKERVTEELRKLLLRAARPSIGLSLLRDLGILARDYPELAACAETPQEPEWHPEGDVWVHTLMVVDAAATLVAEQKWDLTPNSAEALHVLLGALCHDLGKPATTEIGEKNGVPRIRSLGHEDAGIEPTKSLLKRWTFGEDAERTALAGAAEHLKPGQLYLQQDKGGLTEDQYANAIRKLLKRIHPVPWRVLLAIAEADYRGRTIPGVQTAPFVYGDAFAATITKHHLDEAATKPLVFGRDLLTYGIPPGPQMGALIAEIEALRDTGTIKTRDEALAYLATRLK